MLQRRDRREWAVLGLVALGWALLVAPALHRQTHAHGVDHTHGAPKAPAPTDSHGDGSFEHQAVTFTAPATAPAMTGVLLALATPRVASRAAPVVPARRRVEQSQAP